MRYTKLILLFIVLALLASCNDDSSTGPNDDPNDLGIPIGEYMPAKLGSMWEYSFNYNGTIASSSTRVLGTREFDSGIYVEFEEIVNNQTPGKSYKKYTDGKYYSLIPDASSSAIGDFQFLLFDIAANKGDEWEKTVALQTPNNKKDSSIYELELFDKLDTYMVKGVNYNDIIVIKLDLHYKTEAGSIFQLSEHLYYYAKNVGLIKLVVQTEVETIIQELKTYTL